MGRVIASGSGSDDGRWWRDKERQKGEGREGRYTRKSTKKITRTTRTPPRARTACGQHHQVSFGARARTLHRSPSTSYCTESETKKRRRKKREGLWIVILIRLTRTENSFAFIVTIHPIPPTSVLYCAPKAAYRSIARSWVSFLITFTAFFVPMLTK